MLGHRHLQRPVLFQLMRHARSIPTLMLAATLAAGPVSAAPGVKDTKPYDDRLMRLAEILGAVHFLRELCGANEGQMWRERMDDLIKAEGTSALRQARLTRGFNQGYRNYARTYTTCTPTAQTAASRFLAEGAQISDSLVKSIP